MTDEMGVCPCMSAAARKVKKIMVKGMPVGLVGLDEIMKEFCCEKKPPTEETAKELYRKVRVYNYIPLKAKDAYVEALKREYERYYRANYPEVADGKE